MRAQEFLNDSELQEMPLPADWDPEQSSKLGCL
jgi:hypothetical protein